MPADTDEGVRLVARRLCVLEHRASEVLAGVRRSRGLDRRRLQQVQASRRRLLRERPWALQALDAELPQQLVFVEVRGVVQAVGLLGCERYPVERVVGEERVPFLEASLVEQARLA